MRRDFWYDHFRGDGLWRSIHCAPNIGGPIELIEDGYNGFCVDVTDAKVVAEKIKEVLGLDNYERFADNALAGFERFR